MKFTCDTKELSRACNTVSRAAATKASIPALEGIKIDIKGKEVRLCGYNLELGITTMLESKGGSEEDGSVVLDAKMLCNIVKKLPNALTTIQADKKSTVTIKSGDSEFQLVYIPADKFPELPKIDEKSAISIPQAVFKEMIQQTIFAVADDAAKPIYTGALFKVEDGGLTMVGVDGYRLAKCHESIDYHGQPFDCVVPKKALLEISSLLDESGDKAVDISIGLRHAAFMIGNYVIFTRLLEGEFLDYEKAIPKSHATEIKVDVRTLVESVNRVALVVSEYLRSPIKMHVGNGQIGLSCATFIGAASDTLDANISGDDLLIGFNHKYLSDALRNAGCDEVRLQLNGPLSPMVVLPNSGDSFVFLVLPVRLKAG